MKDNYVIFTLHQQIEENIDLGFQTAVKLENLCNFGLKHRKIQYGGCEV